MKATTVSTAAMPFQGQDVDKLIQCNQKLKELGIDSAIKLPQICVVGDQSTGMVPNLAVDGPLTAPQARVHSLKPSL